MLELPGEPLAGALAWAVGVGADVGGVVLAAEACGWQAVRAVDSISTARTAPAFRAVRGIGFIGLLILGGWNVFGLCLPRAEAAAGGAMPRVRLIPAGRFCPGCAPVAPGHLRR